jgi:uncharacterized membrane protein
MREAAKTASYATMHFTVAAAVAYAVTGDWRAALAISMIEPLVQTVAYVLHERAWAKGGKSSAAPSALHAHG